MSFFNGDIKSSELTLSSSTASNPVLTIENTTDDASSAIIKFIKNRGVDAQDGDDVGVIQFWSYDDGTPSTQQYASILVEVSDASSSSEGGVLSIKVAEHDGTVTTGLKIQDGDVDGELDVTIGAGTSSVTTISGDLKVITDIILDDGGSLKEAGGTAAITFDGSGHVTKIGQDSPSSGQFLKWDGSKAVWDAAGGGGGGATIQSGNPTTNTVGSIGDFIVATGSARLYVLTSIPGGSSHIWWYVSLTEF